MAELQVGQLSRQSRGAALECHFNRKEELRQAVGRGMVGVLLSSFLFISASRGRQLTSGKIFNFS